MNSDARQRWSRYHTPRLGGTATPTGERCTFVDCPKPGFVQARGMCADCFLQTEIEPLEAELRLLNDAWLSALDAESLVKPVFKCSCGLVTDYYLRDKHFIDTDSTHQPTYAHRRPELVENRPTRHRTPTPPPPPTDKEEDFA